MPGAAGAIEVYGYEWSFGYCPSGSGVYKMKPMGNKMYTFRESLPLGETPLSQTQFHSVLKQLQAEYQGCTYDLLTRNCCHFCEELTERLSSESIPGTFSMGTSCMLLYLNIVAMNCNGTMKQAGACVQMSDCCAVSLPP